MTEVNAELKKQNRDIGEDSDAGSGAEEDGGSWEGVQEAVQVEALPGDEEYVDEDKYTTVTVEAMDGAEDVDDVGDDDEFPIKAIAPNNSDAPTKAAAKKRIWSKDGQAKSKKKKFRYESKAERQQTRQKQKSKNHKAKLRREGK